MNKTSLQAPLSLEILQEYNKLKNLIASIDLPYRFLKIIEGTGGKVSIDDLIAYQIGWGNCLISWYESGLKGEIPLMPGAGFSTWDYTAIAKHFYQKYHDNIDETFHLVVLKLLDIVEKEHKSDNLDKEDIWPWCTLRSGKKWPLSKWIRVNSCSPYKRAYLLIKKATP